MLQAKIINAIQGGLNNKDSDFQAGITSIINEGVVSGLEVSATEVSTGSAFILATRTNITPNENWLVYVKLTEAYGLDAIGNNKKVYIELRQSNLNDITLNTRPMGDNIAEIKVNDAFPTSNYIALAETDGIGTVFDLRESISLKNELVQASTFQISELRGGNWKVVYTNGQGKGEELSLGSNGQVLTSAGTSNAPIWTSPSIDILSLSSLQVLKGDHNIVVNDGVSGKKSEIYDIFKLIPSGKTYATYTAGEAITTGDVIYLTGGLAYKAHASSLGDNLIVVGVALEDATTSSTFVATTEGLSLIKEYGFLGTSFLSNTPGMLASTAGTFSVELGSISNKQNWLTINDGTSQVIAGTLNTFGEDNTEYTSPTSDTWVLATSFTILLTGVYTISHQHRQTSLVSPSAASRIYKNGVAFGTERNPNSTTYQTFSENLTFAKGDLCQLYFRGNNFSSSAVVRNFNAKGRIIKQ